MGPLNYWSTDQYLSFQSHHPLRHKLAVMRTLLDGSNSIITERKDRRKEEEHIRTALHTCGYPDCAINRVKDQGRVVRNPISGTQD